MLSIRNMSCTILKLRPKTTRIKQNKLIQFKQLWSWYDSYKNVLINNGPNKYYINISNFLIYIV